MKKLIKRLPILLIIRYSILLIIIHLFLIAPACLNKYFQHYVDESCYEATNSTSPTSPEFDRCMRQRQIVYLFLVFGFVRILSNRFEYFLTRRYSKCHMRRQVSGRHLAITLGVPFLIRCLFRTIQLEPNLPVYVLCLFLSTSLSFYPYAKDLILLGKYMITAVQRRIYDESYQFLIGLVTIYLYFTILTIEILDISLGLFCPQLLFGIPILFPNFNFPLILFLLHNFIIKHHRKMPLLIYEVYDEDCFVLLQRMRCLSLKDCPEMSVARILDAKPSETTTIQRRELNGRIVQIRDLYELEKILPCSINMSFKLFIIPWLLHAVKYVTSQAPSAPTPNEMLYMNQNAFYDFLQRQHQYNNAILMNNALLTNTMTASAHQASQLQPGLIFHPSFGTLSNQIPSQFPTSNQQFNLLNPAQLGIANGAASAPLYEAYSAGVKTQSFETGANQKLEAIKTESDEADSRDSPISSTPASATTYSTSQILITSTSKTTTSTPIEEKLKVDDSNQENTDKSGSESDLYGLLRNINLTENEKANLVQYVHEIVKEELAKKFSQKVSAPSPPEESVNSPSSDYNEVSAEDSEDMPTTFSVSYEAVTVPSRSDLPEIKLHPPKHTIDKDLVIQTHPIKTSEKHILVAEKLAEDETTDKLRQFSEELPARRDDSDNDLLELETGAPLDLEEAESVTQPLPYRSRKAKSEKTTPSTPTTRSMIQTQPIPRTRALPHQETMFDKLAKDYQERLSGTGDISKMLKTFYDNAYIQLIASESRNQQRQRKVQRKAVARHLIGRH